MSCQNLEGGYACGCPAGYLLNPDNTTCRDLDECTTGQHICQQLCINTHGSYKCGCQPGYRQIGDHCAGTIILILYNQWLFLFALRHTLFRYYEISIVHYKKTKRCTCYLRFYIDHDVCNRYCSFLSISNKSNLIKYLRTNWKNYNFLQFFTILKFLYTSRDKIYTLLYLR